MQQEQLPLSTLTEREQIDRLRLIRSHRVGPATYVRLMDEHGSAAAALAALPEIARGAGVKAYRVCPYETAVGEYQVGLELGAVPLFLGEGDYPALLSQISDAPPVLWAIGNIDLLKRDSVALVGARNASSLGGRMARLLAGEIGKAGFVITSGLARGIDTAAHMAALETGTIAVMAGGVDVIYPTENTRLAEDIATQGLRLSEQPVGMPPQARHFPRRNRIISGLSKGVVVVEGAAKSGSLITARAALDQGREVMAVPGHPLDARASGCNMLIRDGASLVRSGTDVAEALAAMQLREPAPKQLVDPPKKETPSDLPAQILKLLGPNPIPEDQLIRDLNLPARAVSTHIQSLELEGRLERHAGGMLAIAV